MTLVNFALFDVVGALRELIYNLSAFVYQIIIYLYKIFEKLCSARILDSEILDSMASRVGVILGIIMLFMTMFSVVQLVLEPEKLTDKEKGVGNIVKKILIVIVMLGMSSSVFSLMYGVQKTVIKSGIINKFLLPYELTEEAEENFGGLLASNLFTAFFDLHERYKSDGIDGDEEGIQTCINSLRGEIIAYGTFSQGLTCINNKDSNDNYYVDFNWLLLPIVGAFAVYFIFSYCLSVGMRTFQLTVLEVISPMAIVSYLSPKKDTMFQKWWKIYFSTYVDVFIRIAIINVSVFLIGVIFDANMSGTFWESVGGKTTEWYTNTLLTVFIIISLLMFAKKAPDLLKELFPGAPSKLGFGITPPKKLIDNMAGADLIKRGYGAVSVGANTFQKNFRKNVGKAWETFRDPKASSAEKATALARATLGSAWSIAGGMRRGLMTTNASQRRTAADNAYNMTQAKQKLHDAGYGASAFGLLTKKGRAAIGTQFNDQLKGFWGRDQMISDMTNASDSAIHALQQKLNEEAQKYAGSYHIQASLSSPGNYLVTNEKGKVITDSNGVPRIFSDTDAVAYVDANDPKGAHGSDALIMAEIDSQIGKSKSTNKALHQKENEAKSKEKK